MNCSQIKEKLVEYIEGLLDGNQEKQIREHLNKCFDCQAELDELNELQAKLKESSEQFKQVSLENRVTDRIIRQQNQKLNQKRLLENLKLYLRKLQKNKLSRKLKNKLSKKL